jgi:GAF domain-containing protein
VFAWAQRLADLVALGLPSRHIAVLVDDPSAGALRLVGQVWGGAQGTGEVVVGEWLVPRDGSVCGRVFRSGTAALRADVSLDPDDRSFPADETRSSLTIPVLLGDAVVGVVNVEAPWVSAFSVADFERLTKLVAEAAAEMPMASAATDSPAA